jgi:hypothetical protein
VTASSPSLQWCTSEAIFQFALHTDEGNVPV